MRLSIRISLAAQPGRVARAVEPLLVRADDLCDLADTGNAAHHALARGRVLLVGEPVARAWAGPTSARMRSDTDDSAYIV